MSTTIQKYSNEEEIKVHLVIPWLEKLGYNKGLMEFEKTIEVQEGRKKKSIYADIVIYSNKRKETPLIVVDTKSPNEVLDKSDRDQVISYARLLPKIAPLAVLANGYTIQVFQTLDKSRLKDLPPKKDLIKNFVSAVLSKNIQTALRKEAKKELFVIDDVGVFKNLLKKCHNTIRNNEGYDPIQAFDELSKVLFSKMYEEKYNEDENRFTVDIFDETLKKLKVNIVQQQFSEIQKIKEFKSLFPKNTIIELKDRTIREIVRVFEKFDLTLTNFDVKGEAFEYFLSDTFTGGLGEYFTPRNVVEFMVEAISPKIGDKIVDPFCGTGGFLIYAFDMVSEKIRLNDFSNEQKKKWRIQLSNDCLFGTDWKPRTSQSCKMNMIVHGDGNTGIHQHNGFLNIPDVIEDEMFDICFTNPPFGAVETDKQILNQFTLGTGRNSQKREILAIERCINLVKPRQGIVAFILPDGLLNNDKSAYVRDFINENADILAVIGLNKETFEGYNATVKTSILILRRKEKPQIKINHQAFFAVCTNSGYAPTGEQVAGNQLPDILFDYHNYLKGDTSDKLYPYGKVVTILKPTDRIDAERYISTFQELTLDNHAKFSEDIFQEISKLKNLSVQVKDALQKVYSEKKFDFTPMDKLIEPIKNRVQILPEKEYRQMGVRGKAKGVFVRGKSWGKDIKSKYLFEIKEGWLIYSRLFAKNGSFAYVTKEFNGGIVSGEFPTFKVVTDQFDKKDVLDYLVFYLSSPQMIDYITRLTTGSTKESRARFKAKQLLTISVPIPKPNIFEEVVTSIRLISEIQRKIDSLSKKIEDLPKTFQISFPENK